MSSNYPVNQAFYAVGAPVQQHYGQVAMIRRGMPDQMWQSPGPAAHHRSAIGSTATYCRPQLLHAYSKAPPPPPSFSYYPLNPRPQFQFQHPPPPQTAAAWSVSGAPGASYAYGGNSIATSAGMSQQRGQFPQYAVRGRRPGTGAGGSASNGNGHGAMHVHAPVPGGGGSSTWKAENRRRPGSPEFESSESSESSGVNDLDQKRKKRKSAHTSKDMAYNQALYSGSEHASPSQSQRYSSQTSPTLPPPPPSALIVHTPRYQPFSPPPRVPSNPTKTAATTNNHNHHHNNHWMLRSRSPTPKLSPTIPPLKRRKLEHPQPYDYPHSQPHPHQYSVEPPPYQLHEQGPIPMQPTLAMPYNHHLMPPPSSFPRYPPPPPPPLPSRSVGRLVPVRNEDWPTSAPAQVPPPTSTSALQLPLPPPTPAGAGREAGSVHRSGMNVSMSLPSPSTFEFPRPAPNRPWLHPSQSPSAPHHVPVRAAPAHASAAGIHGHGYGGVRIKQEEDYTNVSFSSLLPVKTEETPSALYLIKKEESVSPSVSRRAPERAPAPVPVSIESTSDPNSASASTFAPMEVDTEMDTNDTNPVSASTPNSQPGPASSRKLITSASAYYSYPPTCLQSHMDHKANRKVFFKEKMRELVGKGLKRKKAYSRDDGLVIEWTSSVPVWSDTLQPDLPDLATAIQLAYSLNRGSQGSSTTSTGGGTSSATRGRRKGRSAPGSASDLTPASSQVGAGGNSPFRVNPSSTTSASTSASKLSATRAVVDLGKSENEEEEEETRQSPAEYWELYSGTQHGSQSQSQSQLRSKSRSRSKPKSKSKTPASFKPASGFYIDGNIDNNDGRANALGSHDQSRSHGRQFTTILTSDLKRKIKDMDRGMGIVHPPLSTPTPEAAGAGRAGAAADAEKEVKAMPTPMPTPTTKPLPGHGTAQRSTHMPTPSFSSAGSSTPTPTPTLASSATPGLTPDLQSTSQPNLTSNSNVNVKPRPRPLPLPGRKRLPLPGRAHLQSQIQSQSQAQKVLATPNPTPSPTRVTPAQTHPTQHHQAQSQSHTQAQAQVLLPVAFSPRQSRFTTPTLQQSQQQSSLSPLAVANAQQQHQLQQEKQEGTGLVSPPPKTVGSVRGSVSPTHTASGLGDAAGVVGATGLNGAGADSAGSGSSTNGVGVRRSTTPASSSKTSVLSVEAPSGIGAADLGTGEGESESVNVDGAAARRSATPGSVSSSATLVPPPATTSPLQPAATATPSSSLSSFGTALASAVSRYPDQVSERNPSPSTAAEGGAGGPLPAPSLSEVTVKEEAVDDLEGPELKDHTEKRAPTPPSVPAQAQIMVDAQIDVSELSGGKDMDVDNESDGTEVDDAAVASALLLSSLERPASAGSAGEGVHPGGIDADLGADADADMPMDADVAMDVPVNGEVDAEVDEDDVDGSVSTDGGEVVALVTEFLQRYCQLFDTDRSKLEMAYAPNALFSCRRHDLGDSQFSKPGLSTPPASPSPSIPIVTQGRTQIVNELLAMGPYVFCPRGKARNLHFDAVVVDAPSSLPLPTSTTTSNMKNPGLGDILLTVHGEVVLPHVEDLEKDHILAFDQSFLLRKPEAVGMSTDASNGTLSAGAHTESESGTADDGDSDDSQVDGTGQSVKQGWPLLAVSHQMTVRAELLLDAERMEEELPWVKEILE